MRNDIIIIFAILALVGVVAWIADLQQHPEVTVGTLIADYNPTQATGTNDIDMPMNGSTQEPGLIGSLFGFAFEIPIIGGILSFIASLIDGALFVIGSVLSSLTLVTNLFGIMPAWFSVVIVAMVIWVIILIYDAAMPAR